MPGRTTYYSFIDAYYSSNSLTAFGYQWHDIIFYDLQNSYKSEVHDFLLLYWSMIQYSS